MQETLVIEILKDSPTKPNWICFDAEFNVLAEAVKGEPLLLADLAQNKFVIVLVPASDTLLLEISLPPMNKHRLLQALPFAIEEHVLADVETLHIAPMLTQQKDNQLPLLIVEHNKMKAWLQFLKEINVRPDLLTSTYFLTPKSDTAIVGLLSNNQLLLKLNEYKGLICDIPNDVYLSQFLQKQKRKLFLYHENPNLPITLNDSTIETKQITRKELYRSVCSNLEKEINLLQGSYLTKKIRVPKGILFLTFLSALIVWLALFFAYPIVSYAILNSRLNQLNQQIAQIYKKHFPVLKQPKLIKTHMEDRMNQLMRSEKENKLLLTLAFIGKAHNDVPQVDIKQIRFSDERTDFEVTAKKADEVSTFVDSLKKLGLNVSQQNANLSEDKVSVSLTVERS